MAREHLALMADVFCDQGAFTVEEAEVLLTSAKGYGLGVRLHAEQIARTGASQLAARYGRFPQTTWRWPRWRISPPWQRRGWWRSSCPGLRSP